MLRRGHALDLRQVLLLHAESRVRQAVGEVAVVHQQEEPFGVAIEASDREHPRTVGREVGADIGAPLRVAHRRHDPGRLVEGVVLHVGVEVDLETVDPDLILRRVTAVAERRDGPVQGDPTLDDQLLAGSTGAVPRAREETLEALDRHGYSPGSAGSDVGSGLGRFLLRLPAVPLGVEAEERSERGQGGERGQPESFEEGRGRGEQ